MSSTWRIDRMVDEQTFGRFNLSLLFWSFLAMLSDGFDIAALASAAPALATSWHAPAKAFGPAFSAGLIGALFGSPLLGYVGDRYGRRPAIIVGCVISGLGMLACVLAANLDEMVALRCLTGIGIGGLVPNSIALNAELSPKRLRATLIVLMLTGITAGSALPGYIQAWLIPQYGWHIMFWIGGLVPLTIAGGLLFALPESVQYLQARPDRRAELLATLRRMRRELKIPDDAPIVAEATSSAAPAAGTGLPRLLRGRFAWITPSLWGCFATALMANYLLLSWLPLMLVNDGFTAKQSGIATSFYHYGGTVGGLLVSLMLGRLGFTAVALLFLLAIPAIAAIGLSGISYWSMTAAVTLAGFSVLGAQLGNSAAAGMLYPTAIRARGVGWALAIGRFGSLAGPLIGSLLVGTSLPLQQLFLLAAAPMVIGLIASLISARLYYTQLGGLQLNDPPADQSRSGSNAD